MGSKKNKDVTTNVVNVPSWLDDKNKALINRVDTLSQQPYEAYTGERLAGFTPDQLAAFNLVRAGQGDAAMRGGVANQGVMDLYNRSKGPTSEDIQGLMNPYLEQVLGLTKRQEAESQGAAMAQLKRESGLAGSFGGSRFAIEKALQDDQNQRRLSDIDYTGRFDAYNNALNQYNQGSNVLSEAIGRSLDVSNNDPSLKYAQSLLGIGGQQQVQDQSGLDIEYQDYLTEQQYPYQQAQWAQSFLQPYTDMYRGNTSTNVKSSSGGGLQQAIGAGLGIAGMFATGGALNPATVGGLGAMFGGNLGGGGGGIPTPGRNPFYAKDGGEVKGYANGGDVTSEEDYMAFRDAIRNRNYAALTQPASPLPGNVDAASSFISTPDDTPAPEGEIPPMPIENPRPFEKTLFGGMDSSTDVAPTMDASTGKMIASGIQPTDNSFLRPPRNVEAAVNAAQANQASNTVTPQTVAGIPATANSLAQSLSTAVATDESMPDMKVTEEYIKQLLGESKKPIDDSNYQKYNFLGYEGQVYMPVFKAGLAMMASDGDFFESLAAGGSAFAGQLEQSSKSKAEKEAEQLKAFGLASEAERAAIQTQSNRIQANKMNTEKVLDPYTLKLKETEAEKNIAQARKLISEAKVNDLYVNAKK